MTEDERVSAINNAKIEVSLNADAIWVYGSRPQSKVADFTRIISETIASGNSDKVADLLLKTADQLTVSYNDNPGFRLFRKRNQDRSEKYGAVIKNIDDMTLALRLQQAQLLKEIKVFEKMKDLLESCCEELEIYIDEGEKRIAFLETQDKTVEDSEWLNFFKRKIDELRTTHIVSMQSLTQVKLLRHNDMELAEKIGTSISVTIPLWRNQAILIYGLEKNNRESGINKKIDEVSKNAILKNDKTIAKEIGKLTLSKNGDIDYSAVQKNNQRLEESLRRLADIEMKANAGGEEMKEFILKYDETKE